MPSATPAPNTLAIVGAGPIGLEAALGALDMGFDVHVFEQGEVGSHPLAWGHVRMFTPWRMNVGPVSRAHLSRAGWEAPDAGELPTGHDLATRLLDPIAKLPELAGRIHTHAQVAHIGRRGALKGDLAGNPARRDHPFRLMVRDQGGRENFLHAFSVIDASGTYHVPNWAGDGGIPARQEHYLRPQLRYTIPDVLGLERPAFAGKRALVIGAGASAATSVGLIARLAEESEGTRVVWATREPGNSVLSELPGDPLESRRDLFARARGFVRGESPVVTHVGGVVVESLEFNSATHRFRVTLLESGQSRIEEVDQVVVNTGFGPDNAIYRELQVHECYASRGPMNLSAALLGANAGGDCLAAPAVDGATLRNPEPDFFILGSKSYARYNTFLLETGYRQVEEALALLAKSRLEAAKA